MSHNLENKECSLSKCVHSYSEGLCPCTCPPVSQVKEEKHTCCDGECNHDACCGKVEGNCPARATNKEAPSPKAVECPLGEKCYPSCLHCQRHGGLIENFSFPCTCPREEAPPVIENWEKEFDGRFLLAPFPTKAKIGVMGYSIGNTPAKHIKDFIRTLLATERTRAEQK